MSANVSVIGKTTRVRGRVSGTGDVEVRGFVEGEIAVEGDVFVEAQGMVGASVHGRRVIVRGAVKGDLVGVEAVSLEGGARVVGEVRAPRVAIAPGALVRGFVQTGEGIAAAPQRATRSQVATRPAAVPERAKTPPVSVPSSSPAKGAGSLAASVSVKATPAHAAAALANPSNQNGPRRPPPPVVPALKKAKGQVAKKRER